MTCKPLLFVVLTAYASTGLSQTPAPSPPAAQSAPVERRPPTGPNVEMPPAQDHSKMSGNYHRSGSMRRPDGFQSSGFHIVPPGMWWKNPGIVERLTLTPAQTKKMDDIFQQSRLQLIDLKANVEKQDVILEPMLSANPPDTAKALLQIDKVAQARADLEKADARMLLGIRGVLTPDQWTRLHTQRGASIGPESGRAPGQPGGGSGGGPRGSAGMNFVAPQAQP